MKITREAVISRLAQREADAQELLRLAYMLNTPEIK